MPILSQYASKQWYEVDTYQFLFLFLQTKNFYNVIKFQREIWK